MPIFKKDKKEKLGLDLQNPENQRAAINAALDNKIPLISKGNGVYLVDEKHSKGDSIEKFLKQFMKSSVNCHQGLIDREDPRYDYILIYDKED